MSSSSDSEDEDEALDPKAGRSQTRPSANKKPPFDKDAVLNAVLGETVHSVRSHLPSFFADGSVEQAWRHWHKTVPTKLSEVPAGSRCLQDGKCPMPMKYTQVAETTAASSTMGLQVSLMSYVNPGGMAYKKEELQRDSMALKPLRADDVNIGTYVGIRRSDDDATTPPGYGTPFYLGQVRVYVCLPF